MIGDAFQAIVDDLRNLHDIKGKAYGISWRRHGELLSIFANITRKVDRIEQMCDTEQTSIAGESLLDTMADLATYSIMYLSWLSNTYERDDEGFPEAGQYLCGWAAQRGIGLFTEPAGCFRGLFHNYRVIETQLVHPVGPRDSNSLKLNVAAMAAYAIQWMVITVPAGEYQVWKSGWCGQPAVDQSSVLAVPVGEAEQ